MVQFDTRGGTNIQSQQIEQGKLIIQPAEPTKEGFIFNGWYLGGNKFDFNSPINENIVLISEWSIKENTEIINIYMEGTWYLEGYNRDVYIKFTKNIRYGEKVLLYDEYHYSGKSMEIYPSSSSSVGYFSYYMLEDPNHGLGMYGYFYSNGYVYASKNGKNYKFSKTPTKTNVSGIKLDKNTISLYVGKSIQLNATITPNNATDKSVIWKSSNKNIATVSSNGKVTAIATGNATITATTVDGNYIATCKVSVTNPNLTAKSSIGYSISALPTGNIVSGINVTITANGGSGVYTYYYIKLYRNGTLIGQTTNTSSNKLFVKGYKDGEYYAEYIVKDSENNEAKHISGTTTISS